MHWNNDTEFFSHMRQYLYTAVVGDILDKMGYYHQFLPQRLQPLREDMVVAGRAMTVLEADCFEELSETGNNPVLSQPFGLMLDALDSLKENDVYICAGASPSYALWGELMSTRAMKCGAVGAVVDGFSRDTRGIYQLNFPTFSHGRYAQDQAPRGKVIDYNCPIEIGGIRIEPGQIIFGDLDGVLVIPREVEKEVILGAYEKATGEKTVQQKIEEGMSAREAYDTYGIL
ncbi:RraA family protein [Verrucomicrobiaceae bacterium N1E253]|uniref:Putative 4-hydroxy-4-methyl-2-oxoglutarate aldolase n=1 Tax=Oceaniferula marina TaxID=2748318 RepID=A0A851GB21_9BACT|nr:RraA family protein [Oceaniferula marina]NWK54958.1 RraA family protein [Oceaniferula marina]